MSFIAFLGGRKRAHGQEAESGEGERDPDRQRGGQPAREDVERPRVRGRSAQPHSTGQQYIKIMDTRIVRIINTSK